MSSPDLLPLGEIEFRYARCRRLLRTLAPDAGGMLVTSRLGIYYLTGTLGWGLVWLPVEGEPRFAASQGSGTRTNGIPLASHSSLQVI